MTAFFQTMQTIRRLARDPLALLQEAAAHGDLVPLTTTWPSRTWVVSDPEFVQEILQGSHRNFIRRGRKVLRTIIGSSIVMRDGESWFARRRLLQPAFHRQHITSMAETMYEHVRTWDQHYWPEGGHVADLNRAMADLTQRIIARVLFSTSLADDVVTALGDDIACCLHEVTRRAMRPWNIPTWVPTPTHRQFVAARTRMERQLMELIRLRRADSNPPQDLLTMLAQARDADTGEMMGDDEIKGEIVTMYLAGHETTAFVLTMVWLLLDQHPAWRDAIRAEVARVTATGARLIDVLGQLSTTRMVMQEVMRLYPPAFLTVRTAVETTTWKGSTIQAGDKLLISSYIMHRLPHIWPDPERFDPQRFATPPAPTSSAYMPFLIGPKRCIGEHLALQKLMVMIAYLVQEVDITITSPFPTLLPGPVFRCATPITAVVRRRPDPHPNLRAEEEALCQFTA
jgi:cytochrome P450